MRSDQPAKLKGVPLSSDLFALFLQHVKKQFGTLPKGSKVAVAVSGGSDSMALMLLMQGLAKEMEFEITALTIDHQLRKESSTETKQVAQWMAALGVPHVILTGPVESTENTQKAARNMRYNVMSQWCQENRYTRLAVAHHQDDQVETFFHHLSRGSGLKGLSGMRPQKYMNGLKVMRPLLPFHKKDLQQFLKANDQTWIEDPSNDDVSYFRARVRKARTTLQDIGLTDPNIALSMRHLQEALRDLTTLAEDFLEYKVTPSPMGFLAFEKVDFLTLPDSVKKIALQKILIYISQNPLNLRWESLDSLCTALHQPGCAKTSHGCILFEKHGRIYVMREPAAAKLLNVSASTLSGTWDNRYRFSISPNEQQELRIASLDEKGWQQVASDVHVPALPKRLFYGVPAIFYLDKVVAAPHLKYTGVAGPTLKVHMDYDPVHPLIGELINL